VRGDNGIPLHILLSSLNDFQDIIDKSFLGLSGDKKRISKEDRQSYFLSTKGIQHKSIETTLDIVLASYPVVMPILSSFGPKGLWDFTKETFDFLKLIFSKFKEGKEPQYEFKTEGLNSKMKVHIGDTTTNFNAPVYIVGQNALPSYQSLTGILENNFIESITMTDKINRGSNISLGVEDKELFRLPSKVEDQQIELLCEIFDFNKHNKSGKLTTVNNDTIPKGDYSFEVIGSQDIIPYIEAMLKREVRVKCLKEITKDPFGKAKIAQLQIITVEDVVL
jgi:hypothetical protein